uniref:Uncharacterized protein n=1 Tax=Lactuca sativa TaxID=4236 RepID=A0A9R1VG82_LACSA|nr:hypothetical protein LSAT_V11C500255540 [Lactuca sativa]
MKKSERPNASIRKDGVDLISNMSDHILLLILSVSSVELRYPELPDKYHPMKKLEELVYWILVSKSIDFDRLHLFCLEHCNSSTIGRWIHAAVTKNVKQIDFTYMLILFMHNSSSLCFLSP